MKVINLLHMSDIHGEISDPREIDSKDKQVYKAFNSNFLKRDLNEVFKRNLKKIIEDTVEKVDSIIVSGDIGDIGNKEKIDAGLKLISSIAKDLKVDNRDVLIVPGNHDLDRKKEEIKESFTTFDKLCFKNDFTNTVKLFSPKHYSKHELNIYGLNSCLGANIVTDIFHKNNYRKFINKIKKEIAQMKSYSSKNKEYKYQLELDIPALGGKQIDEVISQLRESKNDIAVISLHHNPIPSKILEIRPYSNLLDSGIFLLQLSNLNKYIIVLHGHTHTDMKYLIKNPSGTKKGSITSLGITGFESLEDRQRVASIISIILDSKNDFLKAQIHHIIFEDLDFKKESGFTISKDTILPLNKLKYLLDVIKNEFISFTKIASSIPSDRISEGEILELLLTYEPDYFVAWRGDRLDSTQWEFRRSKHESKP